jgi:glycosyltransferase involved in cell wall biosynthesis
MNRLLLCGSVQWLKLTQGVREPVAWFMVPHLAPVVGRLGEKLSVYYCIDDYSALPNVNEAAVRAMDEETTRKADLVFVASATLLEAKRELNSETRVSPHGVDLDHFARARDGRAQLPDDLRDQEGPVIGFFGLIEQWIDLDLVNYLAEQRPDWTFVLIGRIAVPDGMVPRRPNIRYLGVRSYDQLPDYGSRFDAAIIPYRLTRQVINSNPIKLREYLAMGKPIVSVSTPEIDKYADVVRIARTYDEYLAHLDAVVASGNVPAEAARRVERVTPEGWDARLRAVLEVVRQRLAADAEPPPVALLQTEAAAGARSN